MPGQMVEFAANGSTAKGYLARIARSSTTADPMPTARTQHGMRGSAPYAFSAST